MSIPTWPAQAEETIARVEKLSAVLKICTKTRNEADLLESWITHHAKIVGLENLIIADNCSDDPRVMDIYARYSGKVNLFRFSGNHNDIHGHPRFSLLFKAISKSAQYLAFIDTDERLVHATTERWIASSEICRMLEAREAIGIIPTTWLVNQLNSFDHFEINSHESLVANFKMGKPILPVRYVALETGIHNFQFAGFDFDDDFGLNLFLLHLTQLPQRRLMSNRLKLISRGIVSASSTIDEILARDFSSLEDQSFIPMVEEMRRMKALTDHDVFVESTITHSNSLHFTTNGSLKFGEERAKRVFSDHLLSGPSLCQSLLYPAAAQEMYLPSTTVLEKQAETLKGSPAEELVRKRCESLQVDPFGGNFAMSEDARLLALRDSAVWEGSRYYADAEARLPVFWREGSPFSALFALLDISRVAELACGQGRHGEFILRNFSLSIASYHALDILQTNVQFTRARLAGDARVKVDRNSGVSFHPISDEAVTGILCYDAMVHFHRSIVAQYLIDAHRVLVAGGKALFHHSNYSSDPDTHFGGNPHARAFMTTELFREYAEQAGLKVLRQVVIDWGGCVGLDAISLVGK